MFPLCLELQGVSLGCRDVCGSYLKCPGVPTLLSRALAQGRAAVGQVGAMSGVPGAPVVVQVSSSYPTSPRRGCQCLLAPQGR